MRILIRIPPKENKRDEKTTQPSKRRNQMGPFDMLRDSSSEDEEEERVKPTTQKVPPPAIKEQPLDSSWSTLRKQANDQPTNCAICNNKMKRTTSTPLPCSKCKHRVHKTCLSTLLALSASPICPLCQTAMSTRATTTTTIAVSAEDNDPHDLFSPAKQYNRNNKSNSMSARRKREYSTQKRGAQSANAKGQAFDDDDGDE